MTEYMRHSAQFFWALPRSSFPRFPSEDILLDACQPVPGWYLQGVPQNLPKEHLPQHRSHRCSEEPMKAGRRSPGDEFSRPSWQKPRFRYHKPTWDIFPQLRQLLLGLIEKELVRVLNIWVWTNLWFREHCSCLHRCSLWYRISRDRCNLHDSDEGINPFRYNHEVFGLHFWREDRLACPMLRLVPNRIGVELSLFRFSAVIRLMVMIEREDSILTAVVSWLWPGRRRLSCTWISWDDNSKPCNTWNIDLSSKEETYRWTSIYDCSDGCTMAFTIGSNSKEGPIGWHWMRVKGRVSRTELEGLINIFKLSQSDHLLSVI